ncbi:MAG: sigma-54-dependent Fis family transcriptional regulator [Candidatus Latescibacterota bacterium]|nr:MAG: sigma-54-dependent Fis family transcriptional regulator [Candidatus Latescibacterota bacterium]
MADIIIVDDERQICTLLEAELKDAGHDARGITSARRALETIRANQPDIVLTDLRMDEMDGITLLKSIKEEFSGIDVVVMTAYATVDTALETMKLGAYDYIIKPFKTEELLLLITRIEEKRRLVTENTELKSFITGGGENELVGSSPATTEIRKIIGDLAGSDVPVLIRGESGTGKELVARAIHNSSSRSQGPFIPINCAAIPETLLESELFGYHKGAFTGASKRRLGHFQIASGGTLFLDEIGDLPTSLQAKLLRVLESQRITPLGGEKEIDVDIRLVTATNRALEDDIKDGRFREDLYYRINVFPVFLTPLRERREDIRDIGRHLLRLANRDPEELSDDALRKLFLYDWPGNVRELKNVLDRAAIVRPKGRITGDDILLFPAAAGGTGVQAADTLNLEDMEKQLITKALKLAAGNKSEAARLLGITRRALYGRLERYRIDE